MRHRHSTVRKLPARREARRFTNRPVVSLDAYRSAYRGLQYNPYKRRSVLRLAPLFHDFHNYHHYLDDFISGSSHSYVPLVGEVAQGLPDNRVFDFSSGFSGSVHSRPYTLIPGKISKTKYLVPPQSPVVQPSGRSAEYLRFSIPAQVMTCVRRKQRREVLLALGHGGGRHKPPKWNDDSYIRC